MSVCRPKAQFHEYSCRWRLLLSTDERRRWIQIKTEDPGAGFESRNDRMRDCVVGDRVNKRASPDCHQLRTPKTITMECTGRWSVFERMNQMRSINSETGWVRNGRSKLRTEC